MLPSVSVSALPAITYLPCFFSYLGFPIFNLLLPLTVLNPFSLLSHVSLINLIIHSNQYSPTLLYLHLHSNLGGDATTVLYTHHINRSANSHDYEVLDAALSHRSHHHHRTRPLRVDNLPTQIPLHTNNDDDCSLYFFRLTVPVTLPAIVTLLDFSYIPVIHLRPR